MTTDTVVRTTHRRLTTSRRRQRQHMRPPLNRTPTQQLNQHPRWLAIKLPSTWPDRQEITFNHNNQRRPSRQPRTTQTRAIPRNKPTRRMHKAIQLLNVSAMTHCRLPIILKFCKLFRSICSTGGNYDTKQLLQLRCGPLQRGYHVRSTTNQ